jgi:tRNA-dihydrouridine synthase A
MITTGALIHGDRQRFLHFHPEEHPLALQLGGNNPLELQACARIAEDAGFDEVNLNIGCPSNRVQNGRFGACLMTEPDLVAECISNMQAQLSIPVTVKTRTGIDDQDSYELLCRFVEYVSNAGCRIFIIHARKAWLSGLSPKQNRDIPPLQYQLVHQLKQDFPDLTIVINGGFTRLNQVHDQLHHVDGVMIGRAAYQNPYLLADADRLIFGDQISSLTRMEILEHFKPYIEQELKNGAYLSKMSRHILGLFQGQPGAKAFRRVISEKAYKPNSGIEVIEEALSQIQAV